MSDLGLTGEAMMATLRSLANEADQLLATHGQHHNMHGFRHAVVGWLHIAEKRGVGEVNWKNMGVLIAAMRWCAANGRWPKDADSVQPVTWSFE